jgi:hypothetical protein
MSRKVAITRPQTQAADMGMFIDGVKANLDRLTGQENNKENLTELPETATISDVINRLNIIIRRLGN